MAWIRVWMLCGLVGGSLVFGGCGGGTGLPPGETGTVNGKVTVDGKAVPEGCQVLFVGTKGGLLATGATGTEGDYALTMRGENKILVGAYRVAISPPKPNLGMSDEEASKLAMENKLPKVTVVNVIPEKYMSPETSPQTAEVKAGANVINVDIKSK